MPSAKLRHLLPVFLAITACDRPTEPAPAADSDAKPDARTPASETDEDPSPEPAEPEAPEPTAPKTYAEQIAPLTADATPSATAEKTAWTHYKAKDYPAAQRSFALASVHDLEHWKHPFNLACASAMANDEAMTRVGLVEAIRRNPSAAAAKARKDGDLARYRSASWFEPVLRGEPLPSDEPSGKPSDEPSDEPSDNPSEPSEPTEPTEPPEGSPPPPTPSAAQGLPPGVASPVAVAELSKLRKALQTKHGLAPTVRASLTSTGPSGETVAYLVYDYSLYDACMLKGSKKSCRGTLGAGDDEDEGEDDDEPNRMACTQQWFVRAHLDGDWVLAAPVELKVACTIHEVRLDALDLDGDNQAEIILDVRGRANLVGFHESDLLEVGRVVEILRLDGSRQFQFAVAWTATDLAPGGETAKRLWVRDDDGDGRLDLIVESAQFTAVSYASFDRDHWPADASAAEEVELEPSKFEVWRYDVATDAWKR